MDAAAGRRLIAIRGGVALLALLGGVGQALAQGWTRHILELPGGQDVQGPTVALALYTPAVAVRHLVVVPRSASRPGLKPGEARPEAGGPWITALPALAASGVALAYLDVPSDAGGRALSRRASRDVRRDLQAAVDFARARYPSVPVHLGAFATTAVVVEAAAGLEGVRSLTLVSMNLLDDRGTAFDPMGTPVLLVHAPTAQCDAAPFIEAEELARRNGYTLVRAGYARRDDVVGCGGNTHHALRGLELEFTRLALRWFEGRAVGATIGHPAPQTAWREQLTTYEVAGLFGSSNTHEMTLWLPDAPGRAPVVVFNHGDFDLDHPSLRRHRRVREMTVAREFLALGIAVAMPARRGVAGSEGTYPTGFAVNDADATYKARVHAQDIVPAIEALRARPELDPQRIVVAGQSAGGYGAMYVAGLGRPGVVAVVNFAGGRTTVAGGAVAQGINPMMVEGFAEFGRTVRVPVLLIFAAGDSRYSVPTIRASHRAFVASGGHARLLLAGPIGLDGHFVHARPEVWRAGLKTFLVELGLVR